MYAYLQHYRSLGLCRRPGVEMSYCNHNYELLADIVRRVSGRSFADYAHQRIFGPLGMSSTFYVLPDSLHPRRVMHPSHSPFAEPPPEMVVAGSTLVSLNSPALEKLPSGGGGVFSTTGDLGIFGQTFLNRGTYGTNRLLGPRCVHEMTRNQIPGIGCEFPPGQLHSEASWGFGWIVHSDEKWARFHGSFLPLGTFSHSGAGGTAFWIDPVNEIVGVYLEACIRFTMEDGHFWNYDLFQNLVTSAVAD